MSKYRISLPVEEKPVKLRIELPTALYKDIQLYAELLSAESRSNPIEPEKLIVPMLQNFISSDKSFNKARKQKLSSYVGKNQTVEADCEEKG